MVNTSVVFKKNCFHPRLLTKIERWFNEDQNQKDLIVEQPLLFVDEIKLKNVKMPKGIVWTKISRLKRKSLFISYVYCLHFWVGNLEK